MEEPEPFIIKSILEREGCRGVPATVSTLAAERAPVLGGVGHRSLGLTTGEDAAGDSPVVTG